jgi:hypothetical protein
MGDVRQKALTLNECISLEHKKASVWDKNVKFIHNRKNDFATDWALKGASTQIQEDCERLGKLIQQQLQRKQQSHAPIVCSVSAVSRSHFRH